MTDRTDVTAGTMTDRTDITAGTLAAADRVTAGTLAVADPTAADPGRVADGPEVAALPFDRALAELQTVVQRLETGGLPLEESISLYERGVALHEHCATLLTDAESRVQRLVEQAGGALRAIDFDPDDTSEG